MIATCQRPPRSSILSTSNRYQQQSLINFIGQTFSFNSINFVVKRVCSRCLCDVILLKCYTENLDIFCHIFLMFHFLSLFFCRYIAVTQPIKYAKHKNSRRVCLTILLVWAISAAIGSPIVLGLNNTPDRLPDLCLFYNSDFIVYSSLSSFYIPCIIMIFLYWSIFKVSWLRTECENLDSNNILFKNRLFGYERPNKEPPVNLISRT